MRVEGKTDFTAVLPAESGINRIKYVYEDKKRFDQQFHRNIFYIGGKYYGKEEIVRK